MFNILPASVISTVLVEWIEVKDLIHLDSACCGTAWREQLLEQIKSPHNVFTPSKRVYKDTLRAIRWFVSKSMRVSEVRLHGAHSQDVSETITSFLQTSGSSLEVVSVGSFFTNGLPHVMEIDEEMTGLFPNVTKLQLEGTPTSTMLRAIAQLGKLRYLTIIGNDHISNAASSETTALSALQHLPSLRSIVLRPHCLDCARCFSESLLTNLVTLNANLVHLELFRVETRVISVLRHCPNLQALSLAHTDMPNVAELAAACPKLKHLSLEGQWVGGSTEAYVSLFRSLPLQTLCIDHMGLTDNFIRGIGELHNTLTTLHMVHAVGYSDIVVFMKAFKQCTKLHTLCLLATDFLDLYINSTNAFGAITDATSMFNITTLILRSDGYAFCETSLGFVHILCPNLTILCVHSKKDTVMSALEETVQQCKHLHTLVVPKLSDKRARNLHKIKPNLAVRVVEDELMYCYNMLSYIG